MIDELKFYWDNGQLRKHYYTRNYISHGEFKSYYSNGQPMTHCFRKDGKLHGEYKRYSEDGKIMYREIYVDGELLDVDPTTLPNEDKLALKMKYDIEFLDD